jgi:hypothetical protein
MASLGGHVLQQFLTAPVNEPGNGLLGGAEKDRVREYLAGRIQIGQPRNEPAVNKQQANQGRHRSQGKLEHRQRKRNAVRRRGSVHLAHGQNGSQRTPGCPQDFDDQRVSPRCPLPRRAHLLADYAIETKLQGLRPEVAMMASPMARASRAIEIALRTLRKLRSRAYWASVTP